MSFRVISNRIPELKKILRQVKTQKRKQESYLPVAQTAANVLSVEMRRRAPVGRREPNYSILTKFRSLTISHGRPSLRQHGVTLADGWELPASKKLKSGVKISIGSHAPHLAILLTGAQAHRIPRSGNTLLSFYWYKHYEKFKGAIFANVQHPGFTRRLFVEEALAAKHGFTLAKFREGTARVLAPLRMFFN